MVLDECGLSAYHLFVLVGLNFLSVISNSYQSLKTSRNALQGAASGSKFLSVTKDVPKRCTRGRERIKIPISKIPISQSLEERQQAEANEPIWRFESELTAAGLLGPGRAAEIRHEVEQRVEQAAQAALAAADASPKDAFTDVFA